MDRCPDQGAWVAWPSHLLESTQVEQEASLQGASFAAELVCSCLVHTGPCTGSYMPMVAATSGTLSITALARPIRPAIASVLGTFASRKFARSFSNPAESRLHRTIVEHYAEEEQHALRINARKRLGHFEPLATLIISKVDGIRQEPKASEAQ
eukprot:SM000098S25147  [mRNA]  locus=s98:545515:548138:+ [translate_table: standard]